MIGALALAATIAARPALVLVPDLDRPVVTVQALVRLPKLSDAERLCAQVAWDSILEGTEEYSRFTLRGFGQQTGREVFAGTFGDHLYLRFTFPKAQLSTAVAMAESALRRPLLLAESLDKAIQKRLEGPKSAWAAAMDPMGWREAKPSRAEVVGLYRKLVRPESVVLAIGGDVEPSAASQALARFDDWNPPRESGFVRSWGSVPKPLMKSPGAMVFELSGPEGPASATTIARDMLAAIALGIGRGSSLHRVAREANGWSYRQEGFLQPTSSGLRLRLVLAKRAHENPSELLDGLRKALQEDVKLWNQATRDRALGLLRAWLEHDIGVAPIRLAPEGTTVATLEARTHFRAWWRMKFGAELGEAELLGQAEKVTLDDLKAKALDELEKASGRFLIGSG